MIYFDEEKKMCFTYRKKSICYNMDESMYNVRDSIRINSRREI